MACTGEFEQQESGKAVLAIILLLDFLLEKYIFIIYFGGIIMAKEKDLSDYSVGHEDWQKSFTHKNPKPKTSAPQLSDRQKNESTAEKTKNDKKK